MADTHRWAEKDTSPGGYAVSVQCFVCLKMHRLATVTADLNGPSFRAYYCDPCKAQTLADEAGPLRPGEGYDSES